MCVVNEKEGGGGGGGGGWRRVKKFCGSLRDSTM